MSSNVLRNSKPMRGVVGVEIAGDTATVEVETGSELDGFLYYSVTRDARPRLGLESGEDRFDGRFIVENLGGSKYKLHAGKNLET